MKKTITILLLSAAYALMLAAVVAAFVLFGVQRAQNSELQASIDGLNAQVGQLEAENADLETELAQQAETLQAQLEEKEQTIGDLTLRQQELQQQLDDALRYTFDVRKAEPGDIVRMEELDPQALDSYFTADKILKDGKVYQRIIGKSYQKNDDISLDELRYMRVLHYNFDHEIQVGEMIVNAALVTDYKEIFLELFENEYEINSMYLIDNYWTGDGLSSDSASIDANNTSAFCYRKAAGSKNLSNHALGRAIDINPQQNPYVTFDSNGKPKWSHDNADDYIDRDSGLEHIITHDDLLFKIFDEHGFEGGGDWKSLKDYQHFEKEK